MKTTKEKIAVMQAYEDGKPIQMSPQDKNLWEDMITTAPAWDWAYIDYRIKPEPKLRPYKNAEEFLNDLTKHGFITENHKTYINPNTATQEGVTWVCSENLSMCFLSYEDMAKKWVFKNGTPCGIMEE